MLDEFIMVLLMLQISFLPTDSLTFLTMLVVRIYFYIEKLPSIDSFIYSHYLSAGQRKDFAKKNYM